LQNRLPSSQSFVVNHMNVVFLGYPALQTLAALLWPAMVLLGAALLVLLVRKWASTAAADAAAMLALVPAEPTTVRGLIRPRFGIRAQALSRAPPPLLSVRFLR
jgi:hypothetical protein